MILNKKNILCIILVFTVGLTALFTLNEQKIISTSTKPEYIKTVIIDAGHPELVRHYRFSDLPSNM